MMKRALTLVFALTFVIAQMMLAQTPPPARKPGPAHKRIQYFAGKWKTEGEMKPSSFGPGGKFTGTAHNEWLPGGFFLVMHTEGKGPMGEVKGLSVMGYKEDEKVYTYNGFESTGEAVVSKGTVQGDTWNWTSEEKMEGKVMKLRVTIKELSPTSYTFKIEGSTDGGPWSTMMESKSTKIS